MSRLARAAVATIVAVVPTELSTSSLPSKLSAPWSWRSHLLFLGAVIAAAHLHAVYGQSSGNMRALIAPNAAVDSATYDSYQRCLARIQLSQEPQKVSAAREACKEKALQSAYRVSPEPRTTAAAPSVEERTSSQNTQLERFRK